MNGYFTANEISMMTSAAQAQGVKNIAAFIKFAEEKQRQFGNVTGGYNPQQSIEACVRKFVKSANC